MCEKLNEVLLLSLELTGQQWKEAKLPQEILLSDDNIALILQTRSLVQNQNYGLSLESLRSRAPTFMEQVQLATMRDFEELNPNGASN